MQKLAKKAWAERERYAAIAAKAYKAGDFEKAMAFAKLGERSMLRAMEIEKAKRG